MEGLLLAEAIEDLRSRLPARRGGWRFPDHHTFVLPLERGALWLFNRPPNPRLELREEAPPPTGNRTGFQDLLAARAVGELAEVEQRKLDRVAFLRFASARGFVDLPPVTLVAELTGRNCNLVLLDEGGTILGAAREIRSDVNRFRQIVTGGIYTPPPPYEKLDPREASVQELRRALEGIPLRRIRSVVDGIGPQLARALGAASGASDAEPLRDATLDRALVALDELARAPGEVLQRALQLPDPAALRRDEERQERLDRLRSAVERESHLARKRLEDLQRTREAAEDAEQLRRFGDLLLAYPHLVPEGSSRATLEDFDGGTVEVPLDPAADAVRNGQAYYERAKKREARARAADEREPELRSRLEELEAILAELPEAGGERLSVLEERFLAGDEQQQRSGPGIRYRGPHGFTVVVGRNSRENDEVTFRVARSRDVWLHVQGYRGSHVVVLAENREVPFETILFAAQLAAAHSKAAESENVPVDYTLRKNVWKVKGQPPGTVHFTQQKTVYVTPSRNPAEAG